MPDPVRVLIVDDHPVVRQGLRAFLGSLPDVDLAGEAADADAAVAQAERLRPDVVLLDLVMPGRDGIAVLAELRARVPESRVVVLTSFGRDEQVVAAVRAGAAGYLLKDTDPRALAAAVRAAGRGEAVLSPAAAGPLMRRVAAGPEGAGAGGLTPRERQVLVLLASGRTNAQIAAELVISPKTVKTHVSSVLRKLGVADRTQAALHAVRAGLAAPEGGPGT